MPEHPRPDGGHPRPGRGESLPAIEWPDHSEAECLRHLRVGGTVIVRSSAAKWWRLIALACVLITCCIGPLLAVIIGYPQSDRDTSDLIGAIVLVVCAVVGIAACTGVIVHAAQRMRVAEALVLTPRGFGSVQRRGGLKARPGTESLEVMPAGTRDNEIPWSEILRFEGVVVPGARTMPVSARRIIYVLSPAGMDRIGARVGPPTPVPRIGALRALEPNAWWLDPAAMPLHRSFRGGREPLLSLLSAARTAHGGQA